MAPAPLSRRAFLATAVGSVGAAALGDAFLVEPSAIAVTRQDIPVAGLAPALAGLRLAVVTDVHLHNGIGAAARATLPLLAAERPDVVALIGDICNERGDLATLAAWARHARGSAATVATLGNWEHDAGIDRAIGERAYSQAGVELLYNSTARVSRGGATLHVVGIDDPVKGRPDLAAALAGVGSCDPAVWLVHAPGWVDGVGHDVTPRPLAVFAGHTHGGQIRLPFFTPYVPYGSGRFVSGWYRDTAAPLYVSRGIGTITVHARLFCPPELAVLTLRSA